MEQSKELDSNFEKLKARAQFLYKDIKEVYCPYFKEKIAFNEKGLTHVKFKKDKVARERKDQYMRLKNIHLAPIVLKSSYTLQECQDKKEFVEVSTKTRREKILKNVRYYAFIAIIKDRDFDKRVKVIVKQIDGGIKMFWSIIPYWSSNKELKLHTGELSND